MSDETPAHFILVERVVDVPEPYVDSSKVKCDGCQQDCWLSESTASIDWKVYFGVRHVAILCRYCASKVVGKDLTLPKGE